MERKKEEKEFEFYFIYLLWFLKLFFISLYYFILFLKINENDFFLLFEFHFVFKNSPIRPYIYKLGVELFIANNRKKHRTQVVAVAFYYKTRGKRQTLLH